MADSILAALGMQQSAGGMYAQQYAQLQAATPYDNITVTAGNTTSNMIYFTPHGISAVQQQAAAPAKPAEPEEIAWLKRRVREIEWRP